MWFEIHKQLSKVYDPDLCTLYDFDESTMEKDLAKQQYQRSE